MVRMSFGKFISGWASFAASCWTRIFTRQFGSVLALRSWQAERATEFRVRAVRQAVLNTLGTARECFVGGRECRAKFSHTVSLLPVN